MDHTTGNDAKFKIGNTMKFLIKANDSFIELLKHIVQNFFLNVKLIRVF